MSRGKTPTLGFCLTNIHINAHGKSINWCVLEVKMTSLACVLNSTRHGSHWLLLFQSGKKWSHRLCLPSPSLLTKNKQEHPKRLPSPYHSYLLCLQQAFCHVLVVVSNLTTPPRASQTWTGAHPWGDKWGRTESRSSNMTDLPCLTLGTAADNNG